MARVTVEDCLEQVENRFALVLLAAQRTRQLLKGGDSLIDNEGDNKEAVTALREIAAGAVTLDDLARIRAENDRKDAAEEAALAENAAVARADALARVQAATGAGSPIDRSGPPTAAAPALPTV